MLRNTFYNFQKVYRHLYGNCDYTNRMLVHFKNKTDANTHKKELARIIRTIVDGIENS